MPRMTRKQLLSRVAAIKARLWSLDLATSDQLINDYRLRMSPVGGWYSIEYKGTNQPKGLHWLTNVSGMSARDFDSWSFGVIQALNMMMDAQGKTLQDLDFPVEFKHG